MTYPTTIQPAGPGTPFQLLFNEDAQLPPSLPDAFRTIYPGDWPLPTVTERPYTYSNFAQSRDGRISFNEPGLEAAYYVTKANPHDRWLMGLLRMRADAIMIGDTTVRLEPDHVWSAEFICPPDAAAFTAQRAADGRRPIPPLVILSLDGNVHVEAASFQHPEHHIILATTTEGAANASQIECPATVDILDLGKRQADLHQLVRILDQEYSVRTLLCEGGARVFGGMLDAGLIDEEFVTYCPTFVGRSPEHPRPSYCEGVAWMPENAPYSKPVSMHRAGDLFFLRTRCVYKRG